MNCIRSGVTLSGDSGCVEERLGRVRGVPRLQPRDPPSHLLHELNRVAERHVPASDSSTRALPQRADCARVFVYGGAVARPKGTGQERWMRVDRSASPVQSTPVTNTAKLASSELDHAGLGALAHRSGRAGTCFARCPSRSMLCSRERHPRRRRQKGPT